MSSPDNLTMLIPAAESVINGQKLQARFITTPTFTTKPRKHFLA